MIKHIFLALALAAIATAQTITTRTVDTGSGATTGQNISHAIIGGCPAVSYSETVANPTSSEGRTRRILFARNNAADGSGAWVKSIVHTGPYNGNSINTPGSSLMEIDGKPAVVFHKTDGLWLAKNTAADGSGAWGNTRISAFTNAGPLDSAILDGNPAVVFREEAELKIARCATSDGTSSWQINPIDTSQNTIFGSISLAIVDGSPAVAYRTEAGPIDMGDYTDYTHTQLRYARCETADGTGTWTVTQVHEAPFIDVDTYFQNSLAVMDGRPSIAFYYSGDLYYSRASTSHGTGVWTTTAIETAGTTGSYPTLLTVAGIPTIAYHKSTGTDLRITRCDTADGTGTWTPANVETIGSIGTHARMILASGNPAIACFDATNFGIKWTRNSQPDASGLWSAVIVDDGSDTGIVGSYASLARIGGNPAITHFDTLATSYGRSKFARATDASGASSTWTSSSSSSIPAGFTDLAAYDLNGQPAIPFVSSANKLSLLKNSSADGSGTWTTTILDTTNAYSYISNLTTIAGFPCIAYAGQDGAASKTLKLARNSASDGSGTWSIVTLTGQLTESSPILAEIGGCPGIAYRDSSYALIFTRNSAVDGSGAWTTTTISVVNGTVGHSFFEYGGFPAVVFTRYNFTDLRTHAYFSVNSAIDGSGTWSETDIFTLATSDYFSRAGSFAFIGGHPALVYVSGSARELRLRRSSTPAFSGPWETWIIDASGMTGGPSMLDLGGGTAGIAYQDQTRSSLRYAYLDFSSAATSALKIEKDGSMAIPGNIQVMFEETVIHATATAQTLTLINAGGTPLDITGLSLTGSDAAQFALTAAPATLAAGASITVTLAYAPDSSTSNIHSTTLVITSNDAVHPSVSVSVTGTPRAMDTLEAWRFNHFGTVMDEGDAAGGANPDSDGFDNFFEFSTGTDPNSLNLYTPTFVLINGNMEFTYTRSKEAVAYGVSFNVPWSETLISTDEFWDWHYDDTVQHVISGTSTTETVKAVVPMGTAGRRFLRLEPW